MSSEGQARLGTGDLILFSLVASVISSMLILCGYFTSMAFKWRDDLDAQTVEQVRDQPSINGGSHRKH